MLNLLQAATVALIFSTSKLCAAMTSNRFDLCQFPTKDPLEGCPQGTLFVSKSHSLPQLRTIQGAIDSISNSTSKQNYVLIESGQYNETLKIYDTLQRLTILGQTADPISFSQNLVEVQNSLAIVALPGLPNINTSTLAVDGPHVLSAYNLNFTNAWPSTNHSAALALGINKGNASFYESSFKSLQDTLFVSSDANAYFEDCEVRGQTDFIFGEGRAWFERATIGVRNTGDIPLAGIVAWQGDINTTKGAYIHSSKVDLAPDHNTTHDLRGTMALGRPWNNQSITIYIETYMGSVVNASGFTAWAGRVFDNVTYGEYGSFGPGYQPSKRLLNQETLGTAAQGNEKYTLETVFGETPSWF